MNRTLKAACMGVGLLALSACVAGSAGSEHALPATQALSASSPTPIQAAFRVLFMVSSQGIVPVTICQTGAGSNETPTRSDGPGRRERLSTVSP